MNSSYQNPLIERYASEEMSKQFSPDMKFSTWRKLWIALAKVEKELGLNITDEQIESMESHIYDIDYDLAKNMKKKRDMMLWLMFIHLGNNVHQRCLLFI